MALEMRLFPENLVILIVAAVAGILGGIILKFYDILYKVDIINTTLSKFMPKSMADAFVYVLVYGAMVAGGVIIAFSIVKVLREG